MGDQEPRLSFKPLSEGLGFHPFSDGLPYAPVSKTPSVRTTGTGAQAAGPAVYSPPFAMPLPSAPQFQKPQKPAPAIVPSREAPVEFKAPVEHFGFLYLFKRTIAYTLDTCLNLSLCIGMLSGVLWKQDLNPESLVSPGVVFPFLIFLIAFNWAMITAQEVAFSTTLGKRVFRLSLRGSASAIFMRAFFFLPSAGFCAAGILWAVVDRKKRCWHDIVADLQPTEVPRF